MTAREAAGLITFPAFATGRATTSIRSELKPQLTGAQINEGTLLGYVRWQKKNLQRIYLELDSPNSWTAIFGDQDTAIFETGKTILRDLQRKKNPIIILDLEGTGGDLTTFDKRLGLGDKDTPLKLNVLEMDFSEDHSENVETITRAFTESLGLSTVQSQTLWEACRSIFRRKRTEERNDAQRAISSIIAEIQRIDDPLRFSSESSTLLKKLVSLAEGKAGSILNQRASIQIDELMMGTTLIGLRELKDAGLKNLLTSLILAYFARAIKIRVGIEEPQHPFLVLKEPRIILKEGAEDQTMIKQILLELKRNGVGLLLIQTSPISAPQYIVDRCQTRICHRLTNRSDLDLAQKTFNLDNTRKEILKGLLDKEVLVKIAKQIQPFLVEIVDSTQPQKGRKEEEAPLEEDVLEIMSEVIEDGLSG